VEGAAVELEQLLLVVSILPVHVEGTNTHFPTVMCMLDLQSLTMSQPLEPLYGSNAVSPVTQVASVRYHANRVRLEVIL
jgi:hypothetical protein